MIKMIKVEDLLKFYNWNTTHISMGKCHRLKEEGYLHMKKHVKYPLYLLNYTSKTQYRNNNVNTPQPTTHNYLQQQR